MTEDLDDKPIYMRKEGPETLRASSSDAIAEVGALKDGERVWITIRRSRSSRQHRLFRKLLQKVAEATQYETANNLLLALKERLGEFDLVKIPNPWKRGETLTAKVYHSTAFEKMGPKKFKQFMDDSIRVIFTEVLPPEAEREVIAECEALLEPEPPERVSERMEG